jgi:hypothetical protein
MASNSKTNNRKSTAKINVDDIVLNSVLTMLKSGPNTWIGTMTEVSNNIGPITSMTVGKKARMYLPGSPAALRVVLNRIAQRLRSRGIGVKFGRTTDHTRTRFVRFAR